MDTRRKIRYEPTRKSLRHHDVPDWYEDAKLGIFIHWGLYSVPAYAPTKSGDITETFKEGTRFHFANNPYAEWYLNSLKFSGGPTPTYHNRTYGPGFSYDDFVPLFNQAILNWDPQKMVDTFSDIGARYVVLTTKHHDGFLLWPSNTPNPHKENYNASRDLVGELTHIVKTKGLQMGFYYSGALDWTFNHNPIDTITGLLINGPDSQEYASYVDQHYTELIDRYAPSILWNDIGYPPLGERERIITHFYNAHPEGVVNDRWMITPTWLRKIVRTFPLNHIVEYIGQKMIVSGAVTGLKPNCHYDFITPEYASFKEIRQIKWESCRGMGRSFGHNRMEKEKHFISTTKLIHMFVDIVSKNGNLLLNVGPRADGSIPELQLKRLNGLGEWLKGNGEAIFDTRPWHRVEGKTSDGLEIRFTKKGPVLYAILLGAPTSEIITILDFPMEKINDIHLLGFNRPLSWEQPGTNLRISMPKNFSGKHACAFRIAY